MLAFFTLGFVVVCALYKLEIEAVLYAAGLCIISAIVLYGIRFSGYCKEYQKRHQLLKRIEFAYQELPHISQKGFTGYNGQADKKAPGLGL